MGGTVYLFAAFSITWAIIFFYTFSISSRQKSLEIQIDKIREILEKSLRA
jgi:CcmD family protein